MKITFQRLYVFLLYKNGQRILGTLHIVCNMHELKDTTLVEDDSTDTILPASTQWEKTPYKLNKNAHVTRLTYLLQPLKMWQMICMYLIFVKVCNE
jgi:hypothetical protein